MSGNRPAGGRVHNVVPPGPATRKRSALLGRFPLGDPGIKKGAAGEWSLVHERSTRPSQANSSSSGALAWDLKGALGADTQVKYQGYPDTATTSSYFMLMKTGHDFTAVPVAGITFRPADRGGVTLTLEEAEALIQGGTEGAILAPKSVKQQQEADAVYDAKLKADAREALGARADELEALFGGAQRAGTAKQPLVDADDDDMPDTFDGDLDDLFEDNPKQRRGRKAGPRAERGKAASNAAQGGEPQLGEDEAPEDVYKGEEDELRPEAPDEEADWEHENEVQDDDEYIGVANEEYDDDAHMRKKLGLDQEEDEEARPAPGADDAPDPAAATAAAEGANAAAAAGAAGAELVEDELEDSDDYDLSDVEVDLDDLDAMATKMELGRSKQARGGRYAQATQQARDPAAVRAGTPPTTAAAAAAAGAARSQPAARSPAPPGAAAVAAAGVKGGGQRGGSATPPAPGMAKRRGGAAGQEGEGPQAKRSRGAASPSDAAAAAAAMAQVPTHQEIIQAASSQQMTLQELVNLFGARLITQEAKLEFRSRMLAVLITDGAYVRIK